MKNKIHIFTWQIRKKFIKNHHNKFSSLEDRAYMMQNKIDHSKLFGGIELSILGDSNGENIGYEDCEKFKPITCNFSKGGTRFDTWNNFFNSEQGKTIFEQIKNINHITNLSGNHILQNSMGNFESSFQEYFEKFPNSWYITVPKIHSKILANLPGTKKSQKQLNDEIKFVNLKMKEKTKKIIDIFPLTGIHDEAYFFVHEDVVHFSQNYDKKVRIPFIKKITGF